MKSAKRYLKRIRDIEFEVRDLQLIIDTILDGAAYPARRGEYQHQHKEDSRVAQGVVAAADYQCRHDTKADEGIAVRNQAELLFDRIEDKRLVVILRRRYILAEPWEKICTDLNYSKSRVMELHRLALQAFAKERTKSDKNAPNRT